MGTNFNLCAAVFTLAAHYFVRTVFCMSNDTIDLVRGYETILKVVKQLQK